MVDESSRFPSIDESARRRFESAWSRGEPEPIDSCAPAKGSPIRPATLEELVAIELEFRWRAATSSTFADVPRLEHYIERFPELADDCIAARLIEEEFRLRHRHGDAPDIDEYDDRFPDAAKLEGIASSTAASRRRSQLKPGAEVAGYLLQEEYARGGFGRIFAAIDQTLGRTVAVKQLWPEVSGDAEMRLRFTNEARITAVLEHPGVVPVYSLHDAEDHEPFYTMKLVRGRTLASAMADYHKETQRGGAGTLEQRRLLESFLAVCRTMAFAHDRHVIHRDLKPANILLGDYGETVILDWGLAKSLDRAAAATSPDAGTDPVDPTPSSSTTTSTDIDLTMDGAVLGTPVYMSPEQAAGANDKIDERTDVYALGAILYEVLTGKRPFTGATTEAVIRKVIQETPPPPRASNRAVPRAIDAICQKAMSKELPARYRNAAALATDVERFLADEPVAAHTEGTLERLGRWNRRHRKVAVVGGISLALIALISVIATFAINEMRERATKAEGVAVKSELKTQAALEEARLQLYAANLNQAAATWEQGQIERAADILASSPAEHRGWAWHFLQRRTHGQAATFPGHGGPVMDATFSRDDTVVYSVGGAIGTPSSVVQWERATGRELRRYEGFAGWCKTVDASADGRFVFAGGGEAHHTVHQGQTPSTRIGAGEARLWDATTGAAASPLAGTLEFVVDGCFSPDSTRLAVATLRELCLYDPTTGQLIGKETLQYDTWLVNYRVTFEDRGRFVVVTGAGQPVILDARDGKRLVDWPVDAFAGRGGIEYGGAQYVVAGRESDDSGALSVYSLRQPRPAQLAHPASVTDGVFMPRTPWLLSASVDGMIRLWDAEQQRSVQTIRAHKGRALSVACSRDGRWVLTTGVDGHAKVWDLRAPHAVRAMPTPRSGAGALAMHPDGSCLVDSDLRFLDPRSGDPVLGDPAGNASHYYSVLQWHPNGTHVLGVRATVNVDEPIYFDWFDYAALLAGAAVEGAQIDSGFTHDGSNLASPGPTAFLSKQRVAFCGDWKTVRVYDTRSWSRVVDIAADGFVGAIAASPDHPHLVLGVEGGALVIYDVDRQQIAQKIEKAHASEISTIAVSRDGRRLAAGDMQGRIRLWQRASPAQPYTPEPQQLQLHAKAVTGLRFDATGSRLFSISHDRTLRVWHVTAGVCLLTLPAVSTGDRGMFALDGSANDEFVMYGSTTEQVLDARVLATE